MVCRADQVTVASYWRTKPRRRAKPKKGSTYWTCEKGRQTCGVEHRTESSAIRHSIRLDREDRRAGRKPGWEAEKRTR